MPSLRHGDLAPKAGRLQTNEALNPNREGLAVRWPEKQRLVGGVARIAQHAAVPGARPQGSPAIKSRMVSRSSGRGLPLPGS